MASHQPVAQPLVRIQTIARMLLRRADFQSPETRLAVAVICQTFVDCALGEPGDRITARRFLSGPNLSAWVELIGLDAEFVRDVAIKTRYLDPKPEKRRPFCAATTTRAPHSLIVTAMTKDTHDRL